MRKASLTIFLILFIYASSFSIKASFSTRSLPNDMPVVYVDPEQTFAANGTTFTVGVKVYNLTNTFYQTDEEWHPNEELEPPGGTRYNYSLGNMWGFDVTLTWNPEALEYVTHSVRTPIEDYPEGVLHGPILEMQDEINSTAGRYRVQNTEYPYVLGFNCPNTSATIFTITFRVKQEFPFTLYLDSVKLLLDPLIATIPGIPDIIPHRTLNGIFRPVKTVHITNVSVGAFIGTQVYTPLILGEDAMVLILLTNDDATTGTFNLTLDYDGSPIKTWVGEHLDIGERRTYTHTIQTETLHLGSHTISARITMVQNSTIALNSFAKDFTVINTPVLSIDYSPSNIYENDSVVFTASDSYHKDPNSLILEYTWSLYQSDEIIPSYVYEGESFTHTFQEIGVWQIVLTIKDNWLIRYSSWRDATTPYREETLVEVQLRPQNPHLTPLTLEQIVILIVGASITIISAMGYAIIRRRNQHREEDATSTVNNTHA